MDGVLVFTDQYHYLAWKQLADRLGVAFDQQVNDHLRGISRMDSLEIVLEGYRGTPLTPARKRALAEEKNAAYRAYLTRMTPADVSAEVRETLAALRRRGYRLAVGSSSKNARLILERTDLAEAFDAVSDGINLAQAKPDPEVFLKAATFLGLPPEECAVVEDAEAGIEAAKAAGMSAIALGPAAKLTTPDHKLSAISDLLKTDWL